MIAVIAATVASLMHQCVSAVHSQRQADRFIFSNDRQASLKPFDGLLPSAKTQDNVQVFYHMNDPFDLKSVSTNLSGVTEVKLIGSDVVRVSNGSNVSLGVVSVSNNQMAFYRQLLSVQPKGKLLADRYLHGSASTGAYVYAYCSEATVRVHMLDVDMADSEVDLLFAADFCDMTADHRFVYLLCKQKVAVSVSLLPIDNISGFSTTLLSSSADRLTSLAYGTDNSSYYLSYDSGAITYHVDALDINLQTKETPVTVLSCGHRLLVVYSSSVAVFSPVQNKTIAVNYRIRLAVCTLDGLHLLGSNESQDSILLTMNLQTASTSALIVSPTATSLAALRMGSDAVMNLLVFNNTFTFDCVQFVQSFIDGPHIIIDYSQAVVKSNYSLSAVLNGSATAIVLLIDAYSYSFVDRYTLQNDRSYDIHINGMQSGVHSNNSNVRLSQDQPTQHVNDTRVYYQLHMHDRFTCGSTVDGISIVDTVNNISILQKDLACHVDSIDHIRYLSSASFFFLCTDFRFNESTQKVYIIDSKLESHSIALNQSTSAASIVAVSDGYMLSLVTDFRVHTCRLTKDYRVEGCSYIYSNASYVHGFSVVDRQLYIASSYAFDRTVHIHILADGRYVYKSVQLEQIDYRSSVSIDCYDRRCVRVNGVFMHVIDLLSLDVRTIDMSSSIHCNKLTLTDRFGLAAYTIDHKDTGIYRHRFVLVVIDLLSASLLSTIAYDNKYMVSISSIGDTYYSYMNGTLKQVAQLSMHIDDIDGADEFTVTDIFNNNRVLHYRDIYGLYDYSYKKTLTLGLVAAAIFMACCTGYKHIMSRKQPGSGGDSKTAHYSHISGSMSSQQQ